MNAIMREKVTYKYSIEDVRGMSVAELFGLIFLDLANNLEEYEIEQIKGVHPPKYTNFWLNHVIYMLRNGYKQSCDPDYNSVIIDGTYIRIIITPYQEEGIEIKYYDKQEGWGCRISEWTVEECFDMINFAAPADS